jgi:hypothetical protein
LQQQQGARQKANFWPVGSSTLTLVELAQATNNVLPSGDRAISVGCDSVGQVAAIAAGKVKSPVKVHASGGTQVVRWTGGSVFLRGPAQLVCEGEFFG